MRTVPHSDVVNYVAHKCGQMPVGPLANFQYSDLYTLLDFIDMRARLAWERFDWPDLTVSEVRAFRNAFNAGTTYAKGATVYDSVTTFQYYISLQNANTGNAIPIVAPFTSSWWEVVPLVPPDYGYWQGLANNNPYVPPAWPPGLPVPIETGIYINVSQIGFLSFDQVFGVYFDNPYQTASPRPVTWTLSSRGVELPEFAGPSNVWLVYRLQYPGFGKILYTDIPSVVTGNTIYDPVTGQSYQALVNNPGSTFTNATNWLLLPFPYEISEYVKMAAYSDWLISDGQIDRAELELKHADETLGMAFDKIVTQQGLVQRFNVVGASRWDQCPNW
jgi:hypothetical protein